MVFLNNYRYLKKNNNILTFKCTVYYLVEHMYFIINAVILKISLVS